MSFFRKLYNWIHDWFFISLPTVPMVNQPQTQEMKVEPVHEIPTPSKKITENIYEAAKKESFLDELRSIAPSGRQYEQAKDELVAELKRIANHHVRTKE